MLRSENGQLVNFVFVDIADRPLGDYVDEARRLVNARVELPPGVRIEWAGQFVYLERAKERLAIVVPLTLLIVFMLLYMNTGSIIETGIVLLAVPFSLVGAIWLMWFLDYNMSIAVWVGLIALAGLDAETGVIMLLYLKLAYGTFRSRAASRIPRIFRSRPSTSVEPESPSVRATSSPSRSHASARARRRGSCGEDRPATPVVTRTGRAGVRVGS